MAVHFQPFEDGLLTVIYPQFTCQKEQFEFLELFLKQLLSMDPLNGFHGRQTMLNELVKKQLICELLPELKKLIDGLPQYGEICLRAKIFNFKIGTTYTSIEVSKKIIKTKEGE